MTMPPSPLIRAATEADSAEIGRVHVAAWRETYCGLIPEPVLCVARPGSVIGWTARNTSGFASFS